MSLVMRQAKTIRRAGLRGDPGLGSFFKGIAKGVVGAATGFITGGPVGAITGIARSLIPQQQVTPAPPQMMQLPTPQPVQGFGGSIGGTITIPGVGTISGGTGAGIQLPGGGGMIGTPFGPGTGAGSAAPGVALVCAPGARGVKMNKSGYFLRNGQFVAPGTKCVRVRRRNPLNPRALSKAMSRVVSFKKAASAASRITIRDSSCKKCR